MIKLNDDSDHVNLSLTFSGNANTHPNNPNIVNQIYKHIYNREESNFSKSRYLNPHLDSTEEAMEQGVYTIFDENQTATVGTSHFHDYNVPKLPLDCPENVVGMSFTSSKLFILS